MEWRHILAFYHVVKLGSFTKAAEVLFKTQSALTQQIKALEDELGFPLLERIGKKKLKLTQAGEKFFVFAEEVINKYNVVMDEIAELKNLPKGRLRMAAPFTTLYHLFPNAIKQYIQLFPWVELTVLDRPQQKVIELVKSGEVDLGVAIESLVPKELITIRWRKVETVLMVPPGHPLTETKEITVKEIAKYPLILPPKTIEYSNRIKLEKLFQEIGATYRIIMESSNVELTSLYVEMGLGISFATIVRKLPELRNRKLVFLPLKNIFKPDYIAVVVRKDKVLASFEKAFLSILLNQD